MARKDEGLPLDIPPRLPTRARTWTGYTEWFTPAPASSAAAQALAPVKAAQYFTILDNSLERPWPGRVWLNPPYARGWIDLFVRKLVISCCWSGETQAAILLTNSATETKWWQSAAEMCRAVCFHKGRVRFLKEVDGKLTTGSSAPSHPHTLFYFGPDPARFADVFGRFGLVFPAPVI
jgi:ParB family chromosome partitioning protein